METNVVFLVGVLGILGTAFIFHLWAEEGDVGIRFF